MKDVGYYTAGLGFIYLISSELISRGDRPLLLV